MEVSILIEVYIYYSDASARTATTSAATTAICITVTYAVYAAAYAGITAAAVRHAGISVAARIHVESDRVSVVKLAGRAVHATVSAAGIAGSRIDI